MTDVAEWVRLNLEVVRTERLPAGGSDLTKLVRRYGLHTQPQEVMWVVSLDGHGHLYRIVEVARGAHSEMWVDMSLVLTAVLATGASHFSLAHNHPTQSALPSISDNNLTATVMEAANACGLLFEDHVIVEPTGTDFYSYRDAGLILGKDGQARKAATKGKR